MKNALIAVLVLALIGVGYYAFIQTRSADGSLPQESGQMMEDEQKGDVMGAMEEDAASTVIGTSAGGHDIVAYHYGSGEKEVLFVGGIHGGYEWNTSVLAYQLMDSFTTQPETIPEGVRVTIIPVLNPDGLAKVVSDPLAPFTAADVTASQSTQIAGRSNGNGVDLNRNFDCDWQPEGTWRNTKVSGGSAPFSESESRSFRDYVEGRDIAGVVFWFSSAGGVYASSCDGAAPASTAALTDAYADASGYPAHDDFTSYAVTGDVTNWLAKIGVPAISVLLTDHENAEFSKNLRGVRAALDLLSR